MVKNKAAKVQKINILMISKNRQKYGLYKAFFCIFAAQFSSHFVLKGLRKV